MVSIWSSPHTPNFKTQDVYRYNQYLSGSWYLGEDSDDEGEEGDEDHRERGIWSMSSKETATVTSERKEVLAIGAIWSSGGHMTSADQLKKDSPRLCSPSSIRMRGLIWEPRKKQQKANRRTTRSWFKACRANVGFKANELRPWMISASPWCSVQQLPALCIPKLSTTNWKTTWNVSAWSLNVTHRKS